MRVGIDIDGVLADMDGAASSGPAEKLPLDFWETLDELEPGMVKQLAEVAAAEQWQVFFLTRRPETGGDPAQIQTERWLERHGFARPCVHIVRGSRGKLVRALGIDLLIDDTLENCLDTALESKAASVLVWRGDPSHARKSLRGLNVDLATSLGDVLERMTGRLLVRNRDRSAFAAEFPIASAGRSAVAPVKSPIASTDRPASAPAPTATADTLTARTFAIAAALFAAFAVYGSLVPFQYRAMPLDEALARFEHVPYLALGIGSRADFVSNILLFIPLGFLLGGGLLVDRRGGLRFTAAAASIVSLAFALSVAIEFTQLFFPPRTVSLNDITAETVGAAIGVVLWGLFGSDLTEWVRRFSRERRRPALVVQLLTLYGAGFFVSQLMPFDITIDLGELAQKYHEGRIVLSPFGFAHSSAVLAAWDYGTDLLLWIPIGALARLLWAPRDTPRRALTAMLAGTACVVLIELGQLLIFTRYSDVTDLIPGLAGVALGIAAAGALASAATTAPVRAQWTTARQWPALALVAWSAGLAAYYWAPFNFVLDGDTLRQQVNGLFTTVPFRNYYYGSEFHAFTEITRKFLLALPVGALLRLLLPEAATPAVSRMRSAAILIVAVMLFGSLEAVQMLLPGRFADLTDVLIAVAGVETGRRLVDRLRQAAEALPDVLRHSNGGATRVETP
jgi:glycopeptide antibiotics resistance protein